MKKIGIFEAKTKFSSLCEAISKGGQPVVVEKRGRPMVIIGPVPPSEEQDREDILTAWEDWNRKHPEGDADEFPEVWKFRSDRTAPPTDPA
jgi:antitoxin (DNA-binding transcriptional repressor) of toxin-antitoxin stability system